MELKIHERFLLLLVNPSNQHKRVLCSKHFLIVHETHRRHINLFTFIVAAEVCMGYSIFLIHTGVWKADSLGVSQKYFPRARELRTKTCLYQGVRTSFLEG